MHHLRLLAGVETLCCCFQEKHRPRVIQQKKRAKEGRGSPISSPETAQQLPPHRRRRSAWARRIVGAPRQESQSRRFPLGTLWLDRTPRRTRGAPQSVPMGASDVRQRRLRRRRSAQGPARAREELRLEPRPLQDVQGACPAWHLAGSPRSPHPPLPANNVSPESSAERTPVVVVCGVRGV